MSLRRFRIKSSEYDKVHAWLKRQKVDEKEDEKSPEPLEQKGYSMPADYLPKIRWAHKVTLKLAKVEHGKEVILVQDAGTWKRLVHEGQIDGYLREALLSSKADVPMSRDAGHHIVQKRTVGISRRAFASRRSCKSPATSCRRKSCRADPSTGAAISSSTSWRRRARISASTCTTP